MLFHTNPTYIGFIHPTELSDNIVNNCLQRMAQKATIKNFLRENSYDLFCSDPYGSFFNKDPGSALSTTLDFIARHSIQGIIITDWGVLDPFIHEKGITEEDVAAYVNKIGGQFIVIHDSSTYR